MIEDAEDRFRITGKLFTPVTGYEEALKRNTGSGHTALAFNDAHLHDINSHFDPGTPHGRPRNDLHVCHRYDDRHDNDRHDDDAHLTPADQLDPIFDPGCAGLEKPRTQPRKKRIHADRPD